MNKNNDTNDMSAYGVGVRNLASALRLAEIYKTTRFLFLKEQIAGAKEDKAVAQALLEQTREAAAWHAFQVVNAVLAHDTPLSGDAPNRREAATQHAQICAGFRSAAAWMNDHVSYLARS